MRILVPAAAAGVEKFFAEVRIFGVGSAQDDAVGSVHFSAADSGDDGSVDAGFGNLSIKNNFSTISKNLSSKIYEKYEETYDCE